jgi:hypothetical protein
VEGRAALTKTQDQLFLWPDTQQQLLLEVALAQPEQAIEAFEQWQACPGSREGPDEASLRLMPLLYANLRYTGAALGINRWHRTWLHYAFEEQARLLAAAKVAAILLEDGIRTMAGKGIALVIGHKVLPGTRPMGDIDLYVQRAEAIRAVAALEAHGWVSTDPRFRHNPNDVMIVTASLLLQHPRWGDLDLHWHCVADRSIAACDDTFWAHAHEAQVEGIPILIPRPPELLFQTVVHGMRRNVVAPIRWIADAVLLLRDAQPGIDWGEIEHLARRMRLNNRWQSGLSYLRAHPRFGIVVPDAPPRRISLLEIIENRDAIADTSGLREWAVKVRRYMAGAARIAVGVDRKHLIRLAANRVTRRACK